MTVRGRGGLTDLEHGRKACLLQQLLFCFGNPLDDDIDLAPAGRRLRSRRMREQLMAGRCPICIGEGSGEAERLQAEGHIRIPLGDGADSVWFI